MIPRHAARTLQQLARGFPVLAVTGPRQSGKTTLVRAAFPELPHVNLEDPDTRELALADPRRFLARHAGGAILDEAQRAPALLSYLLGIADAAPRMGRWVLTGSQVLGLHAPIDQSLAGRAGMLTLLPLAQPELGAGAPVTLEQRLWQGGYPALHAAHREVDPPHWYAAYVATYIERDVRQILNIGNLLTFQRFLSMCAARSAQLLNLNSLAADCGISQPTARQWLTVLQASHLVTLVPPYHRNFGKRLVKSPKLYFLDSGLLCHLLRIGSPRDLEVHAARGAVFETWAVAETLKHRYNRGLPADLHFWRDNHGLEVDLVFEHRGRLHGVECKSGATYAADWIAPARRWRDAAGAAGAEAAPPLLLYGGETSHERADHGVLSWRDLGMEGSP
ncbi:MAG: ATP-binding protein [Burkholderiales bacterium]|nr:ATP-binding protein [Burkholderiales bacterium]